MGTSRNTRQLQRALNAQVRGSGDFIRLLAGTWVVLDMDDLASARAESDLGPRAYYFEASIAGRDRSVYAAVDDLRAALR